MDNKKYDTVEQFTKGQVWLGLRKISLFRENRDPYCNQVKIEEQAKKAIYF